MHRNTETLAPALGATYDFDDIGNRKTATSPILGNFTYTPNSVNQYTSIATNDTRTVLGNAPVSPAVTVNNVVVDRIPPDTGTIFHKAITGTNLNAPVWLTATVTDGTTTETRHTWLPESTTTPQYDDDGNLTNDGQWSYLWDAENRLVEMETTQAAVQVGRPYRKLTFAYDWTGRRLARNIHGPGDTLLSATRWLYDGWNPIAEFSDQTTGQTLVRTYLWGMDMSGTMQGAGGVGGLLSVSLITNNSITNNFLPSYDGNGNIVAWTASGATAPTCLREYDSFGNILIEHGTPPCALGFSTKLEDPETSLLYYGYRYLSPPLGRWLSKDPIEEQGWPNLYGLLGNDPTTRLDILGLHDATGTPDAGGEGHDCPRCECLDLFLVTARKGASTDLATMLVDVIFGRDDSQGPGRAMRIPDDGGDLPVTDGRGNERAWWVGSRHKNTPECACCRDHERARRVRLVLRQQDPRPAGSLRVAGQSFDSSADVGRFIALPALGKWTWEGEELTGAKVPIALSFKVYLTSGGGFYEKLCLERNLKVVRGDQSLMPGLTDGETPPPPAPAPALDNENPHSRDGGQRSIMRDPKGNIRIRHPDGTVEKIPSKR